MTAHVANMQDGKTYRLALLQGTTQTVIGSFDANGDLTAGSVSVADGTYNVILTENGTGRQNYCTYVQAQPTPDPQLSSVSVNGTSLAQNGSTTVEAITAIVAAMINAGAGKTYRLVLEKGGVQTVLGTFSNGSLSVGAQTLANGSYTVKLTEDNVAIETWATIVVNAPVVSGFSNVKMDYVAWDSNRTSDESMVSVTGDHQGESTVVGFVQGSTKPQAGAVITLDASHRGNIENGSFSKGNIALSSVDYTWMVAAYQAQGQSGDQYTIEDVWNYNAIYHTDD